MKLTKVIISVTVILLLCLCGCLGDATIYMQDIGRINTVTSSVHEGYDTIKVFFEDGSVGNYRPSERVIDIDEVYQKLKPLESNNVTIIYFLESDKKKFVYVVNMD